MAYITSFNAARIIRETELNNLEIDGSIYKREIYFFNRFEKNELLAFKELISNPEVFVTEYFHPISIGDTETYVFEYSGKKPSYHRVHDCFFLHQDFKNMKIPNPIKEAGIPVQEFRDWFIRELKTAFERGAYDVIQERIRLKYRVNVSQQDFVKFENSDFVDFSNYDIEELENKLEELIKAAGRYYYDNKEILEYYSKQTYLAYKSMELEYNPTNMTDAELKKFIRNYNETYKVPVKVLLREWYRLQFNPNFDFAGNILEALNFKPCRYCYDEGRGGGEPFDFSKPPFDYKDLIDDEKESKIVINEDDDLPF
jgi:hypothetical protein